ncbi:MAG: leucine-rich repeat domain-containing protein [Candidatus Marithrix sp.]
MKAFIKLILLISINTCALEIVQAATDCNLVTEISTAECESLLEIYESTDGANWKKNEGWNETNTPCNWYGITCENNGVIEINSLSFNNLIGKIPNFSALPNLRKLDLSDNKLTGTVSNFSALPNLQELDLYRNQLTGIIPNFSALPNLQTLNLSFNQLTATIPNFNSLPNLKKLNLSFNELTGTIPNFDVLDNLQYLELHNNKLIGIIPNFNLPNLEELLLSSVQLIGTIPNFNLPKLQVLSISFTQLTGEIPNFNLPNLKELILANNQLTGSIPNFDSLPNIELLNLRNNQLTGTIPNFIALSELDDIDLRNNQLTGTIPDFILPNLIYLELESNQLTGTIPDFKGSLKLVELDVKSNRLTGPIPTSSDGIVNLYKIDIRDNLFCKQKGFDYYAWSFRNNEAVFDPFIIDEEKTWKAQLDTFPICETDADYAFLKFIVFDRSYLSGEIVNIKIKVDCILTDKVDLWVAVEFPSKDFFYLTSSNIFSLTPQFFKDNLNTIKYNFPVISDFTVSTGMAGTYTFYAAMIEAGKNPWQDGMQVIQYIEQTSIRLFDR